LPSLLLFLYSLAFPLSSFPFCIFGFYAICVEKLLKKNWGFILISHKNMRIFIKTIYEFYFYKIKRGVISETMTHDTISPVCLSILKKKFKKNLKKFILFLL